MEDFLELFEQNINRINAEFERADTDLHQIVSEASQALEQASGGHASLTLEVLYESVEGVMYGLRCTYGDPFEGGESQMVGGYYVPTGGYPVEFGPLIARMSGQWSMDSAGRTKLPDVEAVRKQLKNMIADPDSVLTTFVAYQMRRRGRQKARLESDEDIPF